MPASFYGQKASSANEMQSSALTLATPIYHLLGIQQTVITKPTDKNYGSLVLFSETGTWRIKPGDQSDRQISAAATTNADNSFTVVDHGFTDGEGPFYVQQDNTLPTGLTDGDIVYIIYVDKDTFKLSTTSGGSEIAISDDGTSTNTITGMPNVAAKPAAADTDGVGTVPLLVNSTLILPAPDALTVESFGASDVLTYWWV